MVKLHHALAVPRSILIRPGIAIDDRDLVPATGEGDRGVEPGRTRADDGGVHVSRIYVTAPI